MKLSTQDIRDRFTQFFHQKYKHPIVPSASLIPNNPTVLLTPAGMLPFVPIFMGIEPAPNPPRAVSIQKCARVSGKASDLEFVGRTSRHHTFFEMLGNFSFGDYFKREAITMAWEFVTEQLQIPKEKLWVTVYHTDEEARQIWQTTVGLAPERVIGKDEADNFWGPPGPTGPCGPCSEIYYDRGAQYGNQTMAEGNDDRYIEIWNLVFMELFKDAEGKLSPLKNKNVDTGMGLERLAMVLQNVENTFEIDAIFPIVKKVGDLTAHRYHTNPETDVAMKIIADHIRCVSFAIADGIMPSNEGRGYVIRMILRRAIRFAKNLGLNEPTLFKLVSTIRDLYKAAYPEMNTHYTHIVETIKVEEKRFLDTLDRGIQWLDELISEAKIKDAKILPGEGLFKLYDTFGFPIELVREAALEKGFTLDDEGFERALEAQRLQSRAHQKDKKIVADQLYAELLQEFGKTRFLGYDTLDSEATLVALLVNGERVTEFNGVNQPFELILDQTPFYAESGGQVGDRGILYVAEGEQAQTIVVKDTLKVGDLFVHQCLFDQGEPLSVGSKLVAEVNPDSRRRAASHHTATHLLNAALRKVLGEHVFQAGSHVSPEGARFDFTFQRGLSPQELQQVEMLINTWILSNESRQTDLTDIETAKASGAIAMANEKYGETVRVIGYSTMSRELCGGTHVERLGDIGAVKILSESAIASGIRRIELVAGILALHQNQKEKQALLKASQLLKSPIKEVPEKLDRLLEERKTQDQVIKKLQEKIALSEAFTLLKKYPDEASIIVQEVHIDHIDALKAMVEFITRKNKTHLVLLAAKLDGKAAFFASVPEYWQKKGLKAGELVKQAALICEGGGGGKPDFAQSGGKRGDLIAQALQEISNSLLEHASI
jgi:alanyl-tRNA synthetase